MITKIISFFMTFMTFIAALFGFSGSKNETVIPTDMITYNANHTEVIITLRENPSTGNKWDMDIADQSIAELAADRYYSTANKDIVGAPGTRMLTYAGKTEGTTKLLLTYGRPWEKDKEEPLRTIEIMLTIYSDKTIEAELISDISKY